MKAWMVFLGLVLSSPAWAQKACANFERSVATGTAAQKLNRFLDAQWNYVMTEYPEWATSVGYPGQDDRWTDVSLAAVERRKKETLCQLKVLKAVARKPLSTKDKVTYDLAIYRLEMSAESQRFGDVYMPVNHLDGFQIDAIHTLNSMPADTVADFENILKRLERLPEVEKNSVELMREGLKRKLTPVKILLAKINNQIDALTTAKPEDSPLYVPFKNMPAQISADEQTRLRGRAKELLQSKVFPALSHFQNFLNQDYIPEAREFTAFNQMPDGKIWYQHLVKAHTTTQMTPDELHELGLKEVARITGEMNKIREQVKFDGDLKAFNTFLTHDKQFYYTKADDLLAGYRDVAKRIDPELPHLFRKLPRLTYGVRGIAEYRATSAPAAHYLSGSPEAGRPGWFEANTSVLSSRPKWDMETLTLHEAVPGHHFQIAVAQELKDLPNFRRYGGFTAFSEGWALYAESLGDELGLFKSPYSKYGNLSAEMMRAIRLVLDTGLHAKGWSKQQALDFYRSHMPISDSDSEIEVDRYITWPGQALAYKVGQLKIRELRTASERELGSNFEVRDFHDMILGNGSLPMAVLEKIAREWMSEQKRKQKIKRAV